MNETLRYEHRVDDFYYRNDKGGKHRLGCRPHLHKHLELVCLFDGVVIGTIDAK